jgi:hypothetical protein
MLEASLRSNYCGPESEGLVRYNQENHTLESCKGSEWITVGYLVPGITEISPSLSCREIALRYDSSDRNGAYWIKPSKQEPIFKAYCDAR